MTNQFTKKALKNIVYGAIIGAGLLAANANAQTCCNNQTPSTININTSSELKQAPDMATISASVITQSKNAKTAMAENSVRMNAALNAMKAAGIVDRDLQTSGINLQPQYVYEENKPPKISGYQVTNTLTIRVRAMDKIGNVLDTLVAQGVNNITGPNFGIDNPELGLDKAREDAMKKAIDRANLYAKVAGMKVKRVITINESGGYQAPQPMPMLMARASFSKEAAMDTPVANGEMVLSIQLNVQFELEK